MEEDVKATKVSLLHLQKYIRNFSRAKQRIKSLQFFFFFCCCD